MTSDRPIPSAQDDRVRVNPKIRHEWASERAELLRLHFVGTLFTDRQHGRLNTLNTLLDITTGEEA